MNRNSQSHFANTPKVAIKRSKFYMTHNYKTTLNAGDIIPFYLDMDVLPGDTFNIQTAALIRMATPLYPTMDNAYVDFYYFAVPYRLVWSHWKEFNGENKLGTWAQTTEYSIPQMTFRTPITAGSIWNYMGLPLGTGAGSVSALPYRAYSLIYAEFFRDQNYCEPPQYAYDTSDADIQIDGNIPPRVAARFHDYFSSALPEPQKGETVTLPIGASAPIEFQTVEDGNTLKQYTKMRNAIDGTIMVPNSLETLTLEDTTLADGSRMGRVDVSNFTQTKLALDNSSFLYADLANAVAATINAQRQAVALQHILERDSQGSRYKEILLNHFGVTSPDARLQRPEYLGGKRIPINITQVTQTSSTDTTSPQGNVSGMSVTGDASNNGFVKSFTEHTIILGLMVIRTDRSYAQGVNRAWKRKRRFDFFWPELENLGEQPIYNYEIYAQNNEQDNEVWGYQERWAEYKYKPNIVTGQLSPTFEQSLDSWVYTDHYTSLPVMSKEWLETGKGNVDRTIAVQTESGSHQFIADIALEINAVRPMGVYSIPGLDKF